LLLDQNRDFLLLIMMSMSSDRLRGGLYAMLSLEQVVRLFKDVDGKFERPD